MPATPAWPQRALPRLFVENSLEQGGVISLTGKPAHYLLNVLRLGVGAEVLLFDGDSGEWLARISAAAKKGLQLLLLEPTRFAEELPPLTLAFAPIKRAPLEWLVEKATELGVARLQPVITRRTIVERMNLDRLKLIAIEAAEQCGRTRLPIIAESISLGRLLETDGSRTIFADETGGGPLLTAAKQGAPTTLLIGPEGGFTPDEREAILAAGAHGIGLGPRILRAETAALAAVSLYMAGAGDWR